jgi:hypothetical protein
VPVINLPFDQRLSGHSAPLDEEIIVGEWRLVAAIHRRRPFKAINRRIIAANDGGG